MKKKVLEERDHLQLAICMCYACRKALEAKAALYDRLCGGEGLRGRGSDSEEEEEERYMVDFTRKIVEEV